MNNQIYLRIAKHEDGTFTLHVGKDFEPEQITISAFGKTTKKLHYSSVDNSRWTREGDGKTRWVSKKLTEAELFKEYW